MKNKAVTAIIFGIALVALASVACDDSRTPPGQLDPTPVATVPPATSTPTPVTPVPTTPPATSTPVSATPIPTAPPVTATPTPPPATSTPAPATPTPEPPADVEVDAPIESVKVRVSDTDPQHFTLQIVSGLPNGCASFKGYASSIEGTNVIVTVTNLAPVGPVACTADYRRHQGEVALGDGFTVGQTYRVIVNGNVTNGFTPTDPAGPELGVTISPIEQVEVTSDGAGYMLTVVSLLPTGSSCSFFDGYEVRTPMLGFIEVTITHQQVVTFAPCTADLPIVVTEIPLGTELAAGRDYTVTVNGQLSTTFTVR
ncbi:MAG: hypothetical protein V3R95_04350 [Dehalococcoidia bacterium]